MHRMACVPSASVCYVFGGRNSDGLLKDLWTFRTDTRTWSRAIAASGKLPPARDRFAMFAVRAPASVTLRA